MSDERCALIDARGHAAAGALRTQASLRLPTRPLAAAPHRRNGWLRPALLVTVVGALVAALVIVAASDDAPSVGHDPKGLRYLVGDLPTGWKATSTKDAGVRVDVPQFDAHGYLYGTAGDPTAPTIELRWNDPAHPRKDLYEFGFGFAFLMGTTDLRQFEVAGRDAGCGNSTYVPGGVECVVDTNDGMVYVTSGGLSAEALSGLLQAMTITADGPTLPDAVLPAGMVFIGARDLSETSPVVHGSGGSLGSAAVVYQGPGESTAWLETSWAGGDDLAAAATAADWQRTTVAEHAAFIGAATEGRGVRLLWQQDGRVFSLGMVGDTADALAMAESVRAARGDEWSAIGAVPDVPQSPDTTTGATETSGPSDGGDGSPVTLAPGVDIADVDVVQRMEQVTPDDYRFTVALPDGTFGGGAVAVVAGNVFLRTDYGTGFHLSLASSLDGPVANGIGDNNVGGAFAVSRDPQWTILRVTRSNGERYTMQMVELPGHPGVWIGVVLLPPGTLVTAEILDATGHVHGE